MKYTTHAVESPHEYMIGSVESIVQSLRMSIMEKVHIIITVIKKGEITTPQGHKINWFITGGPRLT